MSSESQKAFKALRNITKCLPRSFEQFLQNEAGKDQKPMFWRIEFKMVDSKKEGKRLKQFWKVFYQSSARLLRDALPQCKVNDNIKRLTIMRGVSIGTLPRVSFMFTQPYCSLRFIKSLSLFSPNFIRISLNLYYNISMSLKTEVSKKMKTQTDEKKGDFYEYQQSILMQEDGWQFYFQADPYNANLFVLYNQLISQQMSFFYFLASPTDCFGQLQPIYYLPAEPQQSASNFLLISPSSPSQEEQKQNFILQGNSITRDSLPPPTQQKSKQVRKKRPIKKEKDETFGWRNQNKDRNILSNILKAFVNHLLQHQGMQKYMELLSQKLDLQIGVSEFLAAIAQHFPPSKSYISPKNIKVLLQHHDKKDPLTLLGPTLLHFLQLDYRLILLKSTKIKRRSKLEQMKKSRDLIDILFPQ